MRIISETRLKAFFRRHRKAEKEMMAWVRAVRAASWLNPASIKTTFGARVDWVKVAGGETVYVFDIGNNNWRLIAAVHFLASRPMRGRVYVLRILSHAEYDTNRWKQEL